MVRRSDWSRLAAWVAAFAACQGAALAPMPAYAQSSGVNIYRQNNLTTPWPDSNRYPQTATGVPLIEWGDTGYFHALRPLTPANVARFVFRRGIYSAPIWITLRRSGAPSGPNGAKDLSFYARKDVVTNTSTATYADYTDPQVAPARAGVDFGFLCIAGSDPRTPAAWQVGYAQIHKSLPVGTATVGQDPACGIWPFTDPEKDKAPALAPGPWQVVAWQQEQFADRDGIYTVYPDNVADPPLPAPPIAANMKIAEQITNDRNNDGRYDFPEPFDDVNNDGVRQASEAYVDLGNGWYDPPEPFVDTNGNGRQNGTEPYIDVNKNGQWDDGETFTDANGNGYWDPPEPYADENGNDTYDAGEPFMDFNNNGTRDAGEAFTDMGNNRYDSGDEYVDANGNGQYDPPDYYINLDADEYYDAANDLVVDRYGDGVWNTGESFLDENKDGVYNLRGEAFTDANSNGLFDTEPFDDANGNGWRDGAEGFIDLDGDGNWDTEPYTDGNGNNQFDGAILWGSSRIMNPITVLCTPYLHLGNTTLYTPWLRGDNAGFDTTYADGFANYANGNRDFGAVANGRVLRLRGNDPADVTPGLSFGRISHGRASAFYQVAVLDRSNLRNVPFLRTAGLHLNCQMKHGDLNPTRMAEPSTGVAWDPTNMDHPYDLLEYPPIFTDALTIRKVGDTLDPRDRAFEVLLRGEPWVDSNRDGYFTTEPFVDADGNGWRDATESYTDTNGNGQWDTEPYDDENGNGRLDRGTYRPVRFEMSIRVPQYQPDTAYGTGWGAIAPNTPVASNDPSGIPASAPVKVWVDINDDGKLQRLDADGDPLTTPVLREGSYYGSLVEQPHSYEQASVGEEPYREFNLTVGVPTDFRLRVEEPVIDLGKQPANTANTDGNPHPWTARPFTVTNLGNVNLLHLRVSPDVVTLPADSYKRSGALYTPDSDYDAHASIANLNDRGPGIRIPWPWRDAAGNLPARKNIWWSFGGDDPDPANLNPAAWMASSGNAFAEGSLRKARPDAPSPTSVQGRWIQGATLGQSGYVGPRVAVVTPFGQPVGEYSNQFIVYEERDGVEGLAYDPSVPPGVNSDRPALAPFTVKVTVTDRQLTEEPTAYSIDRPVVGEVGHADPTRDYADTFVKWVFPDAAFAGGFRRIFGSDTMPAAARFRDPANPSHRRLSLFWTSNRPDAYPAASGSGYRTPQPPAGAAAAEHPQSWYVYGTRSREIQDTDATTSDYWPFWGIKWPYYDPTDSTTRANTANPPEMKLPATTSLFEGKLASGTTLVAEEYTAPNIVRTIAADGSVTGPNYLFFQGVGRGRQPETVDGVARPRTYRASQIFYTQLTNDMGVSAGAPILPVAPEQPEVVKHTPRGLSYVTAAGTHYLWAFWQGGAENAWQGYYSLNYRDKTKATDWVLDDDTYPAGSSSGRLPLYGDFTSVQDLTPMLYRGPYLNASNGQAVATSKEFIDLVFTGYSKYRRSNDIYLARLDPDLLRLGTRRAWRAKQPFARVTGENLANTNNRTFAAEHLEWMTSPSVWPSPTRAVFPRIYRRKADGTLLGYTPDPTSASAMTNATTGWKFNQGKYCWSCLYVNATDGSTGFQSSDADLNGKQCTVTIYPLSGVVTFSLPIDPGDRVHADYTPQVLRLAGSPQMEASPAAFLDTRWGPAQAADGTRTYAPRDRMWLFWTRVAPQVSKPTVWHKTMRAMVQLPTPIRRGTAVTVTDEFSNPVTGFTIDTGTVMTDPTDVTKDRVLYPGRLFFPAWMQGRRVTVSYTDHYTNAAGAQPADPYVRWRDERPEAPLPIDDVANEGGLCAIPDLAPGVDFSDAASIQSYLQDPGTWRVWLFWSSSRPKATVFSAATGQPVQFSNDTDLRYMTLAPRLDFRPTLPAAP